MLWLCFPTVSNQNVTMLRTVELEDFTELDPDTENAIAILDFLDVDSMQWKNRLTDTSIAAVPAELSS